MMLVIQTDVPYWDSLVFDGIDDVDVEAVTVAFSTVQVVARSRAAGAACPDCDCFSDRVLDRYQRKLKDLPLAEQGFVIRMTVRRFIYGPALHLWVGGLPAPDVRRAVLPAGRPHARFTTRLNRAPERVGLALAGRAGARSAARLGFGVGRVTLLRRVMALPEAQGPHPGRGTRPERVLWRQVPIPD